MARFLGKRKEKKKRRNASSVYELSRLPSVRSESIPRRRRRRRRPTRVPNMSSRERGASGSFDALVAAVSVIVESPCSCPTSNKSTALRGTPRRDSEENWSRRDIVRPGTLHATSDLFSLSLSRPLSTIRPGSARGSARDGRGSDFQRRTSL